MTDVLERLRAANPVPDCAAPDLNDVLRRLDDRSAATAGDAGSGRRGSVAADHNAGGLRRLGRGILGRRASLRAALALAIVAVLAATIAVATRAGHQLSLVARAYAATSPAGGIVHYVWNSRFISGPGATATYVEYRGEVWRSGSRSRTVETTAIHFRDGRIERGRSENTRERAARGGEVVSFYNARLNTLTRGTSAAAGRFCPSLPACAFTAEDPVTALRHLYATGRVRNAGETHLSGRAMRVLVDSPPPILEHGRVSPVLTVTHTRVLIDPTTGDPVEVVTQLGPHPSAFTATTRFRDYEHLPRTPRTETLLRMRAHPGAHVVCPGDRLDRCTR